ncbi:oligosaccharide flippase family protein [Patescibacteria group bacterium]|nr:oligosaccharide flippase family protein [Patescibacteria group bacterium]
MQKKEFLWNLLAQITQMFGALLMVKLMSMYLTKGDYGKYALINSLVALFMILPFNAMIHGIMRYVSEYQNRETYKDFFTVNIVVLTLIFFVIYIFLWIMSQFIDFRLGQYFHYISLLVLSEVYKTVLKSIENANRERKKIAISALFEFSIKLIILIVLANLAIASIPNILMLIIVGNIIAIFVLMFNNYKNIRKIPTTSFKIFSPILLFSLPLIFSQLFGWVRDMSGRWFLEYFTSSEDIAIFAIMSTLAAIIPSAANSLISSYLVPILYQKEHTSNGYTKNIINKLMPILLISTFITAFMMYMIQDCFVLFFSDEKYILYAWMLPYMYVAFSLYTVSIIASYEMYSRMMTKLLIYPAIISSFVTVVSGLFLTSSLGLQGAFIGYMLTYIVYASIIFYIVFFKKRN